MMTLGLVLTFATSWVAYQGFVWNLAVGAPDQLAAILSGTSGPATLLFADKLDIVFAAIAEAADVAGQGSQGAGGAAASGGAAGSMLTPTNLMWTAALILLLGTVGVLVTARIALAMLLAIGPVFIVFALFSGTRGLFVGWLRGLVMTAITPLFVVVGGGLMLELMVPVIAGLTDGLTINGQAAIALFLIACVHVALMVMILKVTASMVAGWQIFGLAGRGHEQSPPAAQTQYPQTAASQPMADATAAPAARSRHGVMAASMAAADAGGLASSSPAIRVSRDVIVAPVDAGRQSPRLPAQRARGVGSRFRARPSQFREKKA
jgi:type IV secretion system protein VirB6